MVVQVGIIGMGFMGRTHLAAYRQLPGARVVAFADTDRRKRTGKAAAAGNLGDADTDIDLRTFDKIYDTGLKLIADPRVELVDICVPTSDHKDLFVAAARAGKHVLCEKPMAVKSADIRAMLAAAGKARGTVMIAQCVRFWPAYALLKQHVDEKRLGKCKSLLLRRQGNRALWSPWYFDAAVSGGAIYDLHVHDTDYVNYLFGPPRAVSSSGSAGGTTEKGVDHVVTNYYYPKSKVEAVTAIGAWHQHATWPFFMGYTAVFEQGTLDFDLQRPAPVMLYTDKAAEEIHVDPTDGWFEELKYLVDCIKAGQQPTLNPIESTANTMKIVQAEVRAIKSGQVEPVN